MTITKDQAQMLTSLAIACRPHGARRWDTAGTMAALGKVADRNLASVVIATINAAADRDVETPGAIPSPGSHWQAAGLVKVHVPDDPTAPRCTICGQTVLRHLADDHIYSPPKPPPDPETVAAHVAALRSTLAPTAGPTERKTLADMAEANPELHAKVERLRAENPGLDGPAMREPDAAVPIAHPDATEPASSIEPSGETA